MTRWTRVAIAALVVGALCPTLAAQTLRGTVVDQTGLPLPGVTIQLNDGDKVVSTVTTAGDGTFELDSKLPGATLRASLEGFETAKVARADATRIVLAIARTAETTQVTAPAFVPDSPTATLLGTNLSSNTIARMPVSRLRTTDSLPLLPSVVRGPDGLLRMGGARPHEAPLLLDGFNVTDPATGTTLLNLPFESVKGAQVMRDPMAVTLGGLLGAMAQVETRQGGEAFSGGLQGFVPRPRFQNPGAGRLEAIFPRAYAGGSARGGQVRYFTEVEYNFERIPVPEVTEGPGPNIVEKTMPIFGRIDVKTTARNDLTIEGFAFPNGTDLLGLSPLRTQDAAPTIKALDLFGGVTNRYVFSSPSVLTMQVGIFARETTLSPNGDGPSYVSPLGWRGNWFSRVNRHAVRYQASATYERTAFVGGREHHVTVLTTMSRRRMRGTVAETPVIMEDHLGRPVRRIDFGPASTVGSRDLLVGFAARDVWKATDSLQVDGGLRLDRSSGHGGTVPSARGGIRYALGKAGLTVVKIGIGRFIGDLPLAIKAFAGHPTRFSREIDPHTNQSVSETVHHPTVERLSLPRATATTVQLERREVLPGLDMQIGFTNRRSTRLATLHVPLSSGPLAVRSDGTSTYRELQISMRKMMPNDQQIFASYVRSSARGELNDFAALFQTVDTPILRPGGMATLAADAPHRVLAWGTFNLPGKVVVSPVIEWRPGFPYSVLDERQNYFGTPNGERFPAFVALDLVVFKNVTIKGRSADLGIQLFNVTNHFNPRDIHAVVGSNRFGEFRNSVGAILRGFMLIKWRGDK